MRETMKANYAVAAMLALSLSGSAVGQAQQTTNSSTSPSATPAQPPPAVVKKELVPSQDKYPLAEAVRVLESGDAPRTSAAKHAPTVPALPKGTAPPVSPEVPRSFEAKHDVALNATGAEAVLLSREWTETRNVPVPGKDGRVVYPYGGGLPIVVCAPLHVCILELEPGEKIAGEPHIGDSIRWEISPSASGSGPDATPLIIIKPRIAGLDTTMVVPTDRRAYYVRLESKPNEYIARVAFSYPEDGNQKWQEKLAKQTETEQQGNGAGEPGPEVADTATQDNELKHGN